MENAKGKSGPKPKKDPKELRITRSLALNDYEYSGLKLLAEAAGAKSPGDYIVKKLKLPSNAAAANKSKPRPHAA